MDYRQTIQYLYYNLPMFHRVGQAALKNNLDNTLALDRSFGFPHRQYTTIHVAGTNGKGSVSHLLAAILQSAGYKTGLFTSPHLKDFRERIKVNGKMIPEEDVVRFVEDFINKNRVLQLQASFFELTTSMAFDYFKRMEVDIAVIEVGLGGRLDSTNVITPELSVITNISFDHTTILGNTLEKIAIEKAGIIKPGIQVVIGEHHQETCHVFLEKARQEESPLLFADQEYLSTIDVNGNFSFSKKGTLLYHDISAGLKGNYQQMNFLTVIAAIEILKKKLTISDEAVHRGFSNVTELTGLMGRWQQIGESPKIICDTGHNESGIGQVTKQLLKEPYDRLHIVFGLVNDKDTDGVLSLLPTNAAYYFTKATVERALDQNILKEKAILHGLKGNSYETVKEALDAATLNAGKNDLIFVGGSTFVVAEIL